MASSEFRLHVICFKFRNLLKEKKFRNVEKGEWKYEPDLNDKGYKKVTEMDGFHGVFVDSTGKVHDFRPQENKPSYNNLIQKVI
jgi:hypothetical protein